MKSPWRLDNRNSRASESKALSSLECSAERIRESTKLTFYCVGNHEQPRRGVRLFASTKQPVYRLAPTSEEGEPRERWTPSLRGKVLIKRVQ